MQNKRLQSKVISTGLPVDSGDESPVSVKREGKPATERPAIQDPEVILNPTSEERGRRRRLQDRLPLEAPSEIADGPSFTEQPAKVVELQLNSTLTPVEQPFVNPTYVPRSGYYFQHDDRSALTAVRNNKRRVYDRAGWDDHSAKIRPVDQYRDSGFGSQMRRKDERRFGGLQDATQGKDYKWHHDRFFETQDEEKDERRKPITGGKRTITESGSLDGKASEGNELKLDKEKVSSDKVKTEEHPVVAEKKVGRRFSELIPAKREKEHYGERVEEVDRGRWKETGQQSDRFTSQGRSGRFTRGRDRWGRRGDANDRNFRSNFISVEKWKHDMFDQANRSPSPKDDEDHVAKIEALLAA